MPQISTHLRQFFDLSSELFVVTRADLRIVDANSSWLGLLGYAPDELEGIPLFDFFHPEDLPAATDFWHAMRGENPPSKLLEIRLLSRDGISRWFSWRVIVDENTGNFLGAARDISTEYLAYERLGRVVTNAFDSEQFGRALAKVAPVAILRADALGAVTYVNATWEKLAGLPMELALGDGWLEAIHPSDRDRIRQRWESAYLGEDETPVEYRLMQASSRIIHLYGSRAALLDLDGNAIGFIEASVDISALRENEARLSENRQLLDSFLKYTPSSMYVKDVEGRLLLVNEDYESRFAFRNTPWKGRRIEEIIPDEFGTKIRQNDDEVIRIREARTFEEKVTQPDGIHTYLSAKFPIFDSESKICGIGGISTDVSDIVREREKSEVLSQLIESSKDGFGYCDCEGRPIYLNRFLTEELGWKITDSTIQEFMSAETSRRFTQEIYPQIFHSTVPWEGEVEYLNRNTGELIPIWQKAFCSMSDSGIPRYIAFFATDLRGKRKSEAAILHSSKMASLGQMAAGVAHEVNNPITIIHGTAGLLKKSTLSADIDRIKLLSGLDRIEKTALRISKIVKGLRMFSRSEENDPPMAVPLQEIVEETLDVCRERFRDHAIELRVGEIPTHDLRCRPTQISQVLLNLLNNSFDAVAHYQEKWVELEFMKDESHLSISVTDSGTGIPLDTARRLMEPFFTTKAPGKGTGLGLPISRGIIEEHGGKLQYDPDSPRTRFIVKIPRSPAVVAPVLE